MSEDSKPAFKSFGIGLAISQLISGLFLVSQQWYLHGFGAIEGAAVGIVAVAVGQIIERVYSGNKRLYVRAKKNP